MSAGPEEPASAPVPKIFISYRREDTAAHAGRLYDAMVERFGEGNVFIDVDLAPGIDFVERITEVVAACHVLIVIMGPRWATVEDDEGEARLADPDDFVRLEVETALRRADVTLIPVLVSGAQMPDRDDLPQGVRAITRRNALEISDLRWRYDVGRLISTLEELLALAPTGEERDAVATRDRRKPEPEREREPGKRRTRLIAVAAVGVIAAAAIAIVLLSSGGGGGGASTTTVGVGDMPVGISAGDGHVWTANRLDGTVSMIDAETNEAGDTEFEGDKPEGIAVGGDGSVWVTDAKADTVTRLSSEDGSVQAGPIGGFSTPGDLAVGDAYVWVANEGDSVSRMALSNPEEVTEVPTGQDGPYGVAFSDGDVWVTNRASDTVSRIDESTGEPIVADIPVGNNPKGIAVSREAVWVANTNAGTVTRIDPETDTPERPALDVGEPRGVVAAFGSIWVSDGIGNRVFRLSEDADVIDTIPVGDGPEGIAADLETGTIWVANGDDDTVTRITP